MLSHASQKILFSDYCFRIFCVFPQWKIHFLVMKTMTSRHESSFVADASLCGLRICQCLQCILLSSREEKRLLPVACLLVISLVTWCLRYSLPDHCGPIMKPSERWTSWRSSLLKHSAGVLHVVTRGWHRSCPGPCVCGETGESKRSHFCRSTSSWVSLLRWLIWVSLRGNPPCWRRWSGAHTGPLILGPGVNTGQELPPATPQKCFLQKMWKSHHGERTAVSIFDIYVFPL